MIGFLKISVVLYSRSVNLKYYSNENLSTYICFKLLTLRIKSFTTTKHISYSISSVIKQTLEVNVAILERLWTCSLLHIILFQYDLLSIAKETQIYQVVWKVYHCTWNKISLHIKRCWLLMRLHFRTKKKSRKFFKKSSMSNQVWTFLRKTKLLRKISVISSSATVCIPQELLFSW